MGLISLLPSPLKGEWCVSCGKLHDTKTVTSNGQALAFAIGVTALSIDSKEVIEL